jgi:hypothetical protein
MWDHAAGAVLILNLGNLHRYLERSQKVQSFLGMLVTKVPMFAFKRSPLTLSHAEIAIDPARYT